MTEEQRKAKKREYMKEYYRKNPEYRRKQAEYKKRPDVKDRKNATRNKKWHADEEFRNQEKERYQTPEYKAQKYKSTCKARQRRRDWIMEIKDRSSCIKCGIDDNRVLDFHHRDPSKKGGGLAQAVPNQWSKERIEKEAAKCDVLCANCHRIEHDNNKWTGRTY